MSSATILIVDDDAAMRETLSVLARKLGYASLTVASVELAIKALETEHIDVIVTDLRMPGGSGMDLLRHVREYHAATPVILLTGFGTVEGAVTAIQDGAFDYLTKPIDVGEVELRLRRALETRRLNSENEYLREAAESVSAIDGLIGESEALSKVIDLIRKVSASDASVLITGETGTGKEVVARAIHNRSERRDRLFVPVNLSAIPGELVESELFGHVRGAFTGALREREGKFENAAGGTLFLDEIGDSPMALQPKLLRALQERLIERVGSNQSPERFRPDLYYRLKVIEIEMPPLRRRREDIKYLAAYFLRRADSGDAESGAQITQRALNHLEDYDWPGNVRELENAIERALVLSSGETVVDVEHFDLGVKAIDVEADSGQTSTLRLDEALDRIEKQTITRALAESGDVKTRAARILGVSERTLWYKLRKHGLS
jgi:DNA-binding NtrC family response regulator